MMIEALNEKFPFLDQFEGGKGLAIAKDLLEVMLHYRFFYQDTLAVFRLNPKIRPLYMTYQQRMYQLIENITYLAIGKGIMQPEPTENHYAYFAKNTWLTFNFWMVNEHLIGHTQLDINEGLRLIANLIYPNYTEKGRAMYEKVMGDLVI